MELDIAMLNALKCLLFPDRPISEANTELAVLNSIFGKPTKQPTSLLVILAQLQGITGVLEVNVEMEVIDIVEFVTKTVVASILTETEIEISTDLDQTSKSTLLNPSKLLLNSKPSMELILARSMKSEGSMSKTERKLIFQEPISQE